jgi:hypothetical protein
MKIPPVDPATQLQQNRVKFASTPGQNRVQAAAKPGKNRVQTTAKSRQSREKTGQNTRRPPRKSRQKPVGQCRRTPNKKSVEQSGLAVEKNFNLFLIPYSPVIFPHTPVNYRLSNC